MNIQEIETAIEQLPEQDVWKLADWFTEYKNRRWDEQIEEDVNAGRLDALLREVDAEIEQGLARPL
jgi:hypothetical protein